MLTAWVFRAACFFAVPAAVFLTKAIFDPPACVSTAACNTDLQHYATQQAAGLVNAAAAAFFATKLPTPSQAAYLAFTAGYFACSIVLELAFPLHDSFGSMPLWLVPVMAVSMLGFLGNVGGGLYSYYGPARAQPA